MDVQRAYELLYTAFLTGVALLLCVMLFRSVKGPGVTDRLLSINMVGTLVIAGIVILSRLLGEAWLLDVALIYTMISLVSVLILARVLIPPSPSRKRFRDDPERGEEGGKPRV
ncbi:MAG: sodium:proton antiporter [Oscillibacter sp.]|nr:sodium:proton antiporter [Oscillibacter sp.]